VRSIAIAAVAITGALAAAAPALAKAPRRPRASHFSARVTNQWYPLLPGMRWVYRGSEGRARLRDVVRVTRHVEHVDGVPCATVRDRVYQDGRLVESTLDWYSQDRRGRVWYFGEATKELDRHGRVKTREGSWRSGRNGARPGIFMPARPRAGQMFQQEHFRGHAEDRFKVLTRHASINTRYASFRHHALLTREWTPLEPGVVDHKWYVHGIGQVAEATVRGGNEHLELVSFSSA
jgi:hypothetical protein